MNCKPGDLAIIVNAKANPSLNGRIVKVLRRAVPGEIFVMDGVGVRLREDRAKSWIVESDRPMPFLSSPRVLFTKTRPVQDAHLRPIRDNDGEDETMTWAGKPNNIKETA